MAILPEGEKSESTETSRQPVDRQTSAHGRSTAGYASPAEDPSAIGRWSRSVMSSLESLFGATLATTPPHASRSNYSALAASSLPSSTTPTAGSALFSGAQSVNLPAQNSQSNTSFRQTIAPSNTTGHPALPHSPPPAYTLSLDDSFPGSTQTVNAQGPNVITPQHPLAQTFIGRAVQNASRNLTLRNLVNQLTTFVTETTPSAGVAGSGMATLPVASGSIILPHGEYILVPRHFAALLVPLEVINRVLHKTKDIFPECLLIVEEANDPLCAQRDEQGAATVRYELHLGCRAHAAGCCPIPRTPLAFEVRLPAPSSITDQSFVDAFSDALYHAVVTSAERQFRAGSSSGSA
ncbi:hypothetical protein NMY22_g11431 [Coprinellus aureogranulatus]|nr:hypothetical protein NMY22_g11431 [Coprinellus aureogranulatus]